MAFAFVLIAFLCFVVGAAVPLLPEYPLAFLGVTLLLIAVYVLVFVVPSFHMQLTRRRGIRLAGFYLGTFTKCYATETDKRDLAQRYEKAGRLEEYNRSLGRGLDWIGLPDVVYLQWPFYSVVVVTTAQLRVPVNVADGVWTTEGELYRVVHTTETVVKDKDRKILESTKKEETGAWTAVPTGQAKPPTIRETKVVIGATKDTEETTADQVETQLVPRIQLRVDGEVFIRIGINLGPFFLALPDAPTDAPTGDTGLETYLRGKIQPLVHEAVREGIGGFTRKTTQAPVPGFTWEGIADTVKNRRELEVRIREILGGQPESILIQSGLLREWDGNATTSDSGQSAAAFDVVVEHISPKDDELQKAIDAVAVSRKQAEAAAFDGEATRKREQGLTEALKHRKETLGVEGESILAHDFGKNTKADLTVVAPDLASALVTLLKRGGKRK